MNFFESPPVFGRYTQSAVSLSNASKHEPSESAVTAERKVPRPRMTTPPLRSARRWRRSSAFGNIPASASVSARSVAEVECHVAAGRGCGRTSTNAFGAALPSRSVRSPLHY